MAEPPNVAGSSQDGDEPRSGSTVQPADPSTPPQKNAVQSPPAPAAKRRGPLKLRPHSAPAEHEVGATVQTKLGEVCAVPKRGDGRFDMPDGQRDSQPPAPQGPAKNSIKVSDLQIDRPLGSGANGNVYRVFARNGARKCFFAMKMIPLDTSHVQNEMTWVRSCAIRKAKHLVAAYHAFRDEEKGSLCIVMEYMDRGSLYEMTSWAADRSAALNAPTISTEAAAGLLYQLMLGLQGLGEGKLTHRDLKPQNILLRHDGTVKIADFGAVGAQPTGELMQTTIGTRLYMAPERHKVIVGYGPPVDIWSAMCVMREVLLGRYCFSAAQSAKSTFEFVKLIQQPDPLPEGSDERLVRLLDAMANVDPERRPTKDDVIVSDFLTGIFPPLAAHKAQSMEAVDVARRIRDRRKARRVDVEDGVADPSGRPGADAAATADGDEENHGENDDGDGDDVEPRFQWLLRDGVVDEILDVAVSTQPPSTTVVAAAANTSPAAASSSAVPPNSSSSPMSSSANGLSSSPLSFASLRYDPWVRAFYLSPSIMSVLKQADEEAKAAVQAWVDEVARWVESRKISPPPPDAGAQDTLTKEAVGE